MAAKNAKSVIRSMTGFGSGNASDKNVALTVEVKSANSRYLDLSFRLPRSYSSFEGELRELTSERIARGRVEVSVNRVATNTARPKITFQQGTFDEILKVYRTALKKHGLWSKELEASSAQEILARREVLDVEQEESDLGSESKLLKSALKLALDEFMAMRAVEGDKLAKDLRQRVELLRASIKAIAKVVAGRPEKARDRILGAVQNLAPDVKLDESRLALEVALLVDRLDISEEMVRFESHCDQVEEALKGGQVGKKLDFLVQELVRETNTIGSKAQDAKVQAIVVEMKSEIERIREQVQNLE